MVYLVFDANTGEILLIETSIDAVRAELIDCIRSIQSKGGKWVKSFAPSRLTATLVHNTPSIEVGTIEFEGHAITLAVATN